MTAMPSYIIPRGNDLEIRVKAVPGARCDAIVGALGERLKIRVSAPPEEGKANAAIVRLLAKTLGVHEREVELVSGAGNPLKIFAVRAAVARAREFATLLETAD